MRREDIQIRQGHWAIVDLVGKGNHFRTVPMPVWVKIAVNRWMIAASVTTGRVFRAVSRHRTAWGTGISENVVWYVVRSCAGRLELNHLAPHDLRRTCAKLCHVNGGRVGANTVPSGPRLRPDNRALPRVQAELGIARKRPLWLPVLRSCRFALKPVLLS
ncbi:hypothetical protein [Granulicella arctica]|uniref:hypothetical protein n=1 Tax=Granulicella arctica TaxID=940613 RepID=UPI0037BF275C